MKAPAYSAGAFSYPAIGSRLLAEEMRLRIAAAKDTTCPEISGLAVNGGRDRRGLVNTVCKARELPLGHKARIKRQTDAPLALQLELHQIAGINLGKIAFVQASLEVRQVAMILAPDHRFTIHRVRPQNNSEHRSPPYIHLDIR